MIKKLYDISNKIDKYRLEIIVSIKETCDSLNIPFFIVGATARDIILEYIYNMKIRRATNDIDFAIRVEDWDEFNLLTTTLLKNKKFSKDEGIEHRLLYDNIYPLDVIPFGKIASADGTFRWSKDNKEFTVLGFDEAYDNSYEVKIRSNPELIVRFATSESLCVLKFISWSERYPERTKDAIDLVSLIESYLDTGNFDRLSEEESDLINETFDYIITGARLLGRDIAKNFQKGTLKFLVKILDEETAEKDRYRLVEDMMKSKSIREEKDFNYFLMLLHNIKLGLSDRY